MTDIDSKRRQALAAFLREHRDRLTPAEVNLPPGLRRRTPGLRREEVAELANIGVSWYMWLEQGRDVHPSAQVLDNISQALKLTMNERRYMFLLAGQPLTTNFLPEPQKVNPALERLVAELDPSPAYVLGRRRDYLAWNRAADLLLNISEPTPPYDFNSIWQFFARPTTPQLFVDWETVGRHILAEFHSVSAAHSNDNWFEQFTADLNQISPHFSQWWLEPKPLSTDARQKSLRHPVLGCLDFEFLILQLPSDPNVTIHIYTPLGDSRAKLQKHLT